MSTSKTRKASWLSSLMIVAVLMLPMSRVHAQGSSSNGPLQAFMLTTTYGVIAGSLTGLASLAFYKEAGEHSRNVAIGASLGLYVGILLGAYVVYMPALKNSMGPSEDDSVDEDPINLNSRLSPTTLPWVNWDAERGGQLGIVYNF